MGAVAREWELVRAASSADAEGVQRLLEAPLDWNTALRLAEEHGTSMLLHQNLAGKSGVPPATLATLYERSQENIHKSLLLARELIRILDCLKAHDIEAVPYKGIVLAEICYGDMALRQAGDMDLFVRRRDAARVKDAVRELAYTPRVAIREEAERAYIAAGYECTFDSPLGKNLLELQWAPQPRFYAVDYDMDGLFERAVSVTVAGRGMKTPAAEDLLLVLSLHAAKHVWARLIWLCDIAQILKRELDWDWVQAQAQELGIERIVQVTLLLAKRLVGAEIPATAFADRLAQRLADEVAAEISDGVVWETENVSYFRLMMRLRERQRDRLRFLARLAFTPGPGEWEVAELPRALFPLYRVVRLGRLAARFARG